MGMRVALMLDEGELADPCIGLAQLDTGMRGEPNQAFALGSTAWNRSGNHRLRLHRCVDDDARQVLRLQRLSPRGHRKALLDEHRKLCLAHALPPPRQRRAIEG